MNTDSKTGGNLVVTFVRFSLFLSFVSVVGIFLFYAVKEDMKNKSETRDSIIAKDVDNFLAPSDGVVKISGIYCQNSHLYYLITSPVTLKLKRVV